MLIGLGMIWTVAWKSLALWYAARDGKPWWFVALLFINTLGLLEILYIFVFRKAQLACCDQCGCPTGSPMSCTTPVHRQVHAEPQK